MSKFGIGDGRHDALTDGPRGSTGDIDRAAGGRQHRRLIFAGNAGTGPRLSGASFEASTNGTEATMGTGRTSMQEVLTEAAVMAAACAPSVLNTQPWRLRVGPDRVDVFADRTRQLAIDPDGRLLMLSCGSAIDHVRVAMAAQGWSTTAALLPDLDSPDLLASIGSARAATVTSQDERWMSAMRKRRTDRRPVSEAPVAAASMRAIMSAAGGQARLHVLTPDQVLELASVAMKAAAVEADDPQTCAELAYWSGRARTDGTGLPSWVRLDRRPQTTVPGLDFGFAHSGSLLVGSGHDRAASFALLYGDNDAPVDWLRAGAALSRLWLTATDLGVSILPLSGVVAVPSTRRRLRRLLCELGYPYLVLRIGIPDGDHADIARTPRMAATLVVDVSPLAGARS
jgi:hypothetical protein